MKRPEKDNWISPIDGAQLISARLENAAPNTSGPARKKPHAPQIEKITKCDEQSDLCGMIHIWQEI
jgi:hypothetical protein